MDGTATAEETDRERPGRGEGVPWTIAVDGSAASGKSTVGRLLAEVLGYRFLDTGVMYRAVTQAALERGVDPHDAEALTELANKIAIDVSLPEARSGDESRISVDGVDVTERLRDPEVEENVSLVSRVPGVREALVRKQREFAGKHAIVMAGRDIGTVVLPDADLKVYLDASPEERARRRHAEFAQGGSAVSEEMVLQDLRRRDQIDSEREVSPLRAADDAVVIVTDGMTQGEVLERVLGLVRGG